MKMITYLRLNPKDNLLLNGLIFLCFIVPMAFFRTLEDPFLDPKILILQAFVPLLLLLGFINVCADKKNQRSFFKSKLAIPLLLLFLLSFVQTFGVKNPFISLEAILTQISYIGPYFIVLSIAPYILAEKKLKILMMSIVAASVMVYVFGYIMKFYLHEAFDLTFTRHILENISTQGNPHFYSQYLMLIIPLFFLTLYWYKNVYLRVCFGMITVTMLYHFIKLRSFGSWVAIVAAVLLFFGVLAWKNRTKLNQGHFFDVRRKYAVTGLLILLSISLLYSPLTNVFDDLGMSLDINSKVNSVINNIGNEFESTLATQLEHSSSYYRIRLWSSSIDMIKSSPVAGIGLNNFQLEYPKFQKYSSLTDSDMGFFVLTKRAHNDFMQVWIELGIVGFILFLIIIFLIVKSCFVAARTATNDFQKWMIAALSIGIISTITLSLVSFPFQMPVPAFLFWMFAGLVEIYANKENQHPPSTKSPQKTGRSFRYIEGVILLLIVVISFIFTYKMGFASYYYRKGFDDFRTNEHSRAVVNFNKSLDKRPHNYLTYFMMGESLSLLNRKEEAINAYSVSLDYSNYHLSHFKLANILVEEKQYENAITELENCIFVYPYFEGAIVLLGELYLYDNRNILKAQTLFNETLRINGNNENARQGLGVLYWRLGDIDRAKQNLFMALNINAENATALKTLSLIYFDEQDYENSFKYLTSYDRIVQDATEKIWIADRTNQLKEHISIKE